MEAPGFKKLTHSPVTITVKARIEVDAQLQVGEVSQTVEVRAVTPLIKTGSAEVSDVITRQDLKDLPVFSRDFLDLATLTAGTNEGTPGGRQETLGGAQISVGGSPAEGNNFIIDGVSDNMEFSGTINNTPPMDAIQEFSVQTSQYSAEFGHSAGGVVNVGLKSGTNDLHGFAYDYLRNTALNARPFDFTGVNTPKEGIHRNRFGAGAGGPLKRNKVFLFGTYEGVRSPSSAVQQVILPTAAEKLGDFTRSGFAVYDPATAHADPSNSSRIIRDPFAGNTIPSSRIDPVAAQLLRFYPNPNFVNPNAGVRDNYLTMRTAQDTENRFVGKSDMLLSSNDTVSVHYARQRVNKITSGWLPGRLDGSNAQFNGDNAGLTYTRIVSPTLLNQARVSYNRTDFPEELLNPVNPFDQMQIPGWILSPAAYGLPQLGITNLNGYSISRAGGLLPPPARLTENTDQFLDTLSWQKGKHSIKVGGELDHIREDRFQFRNGGGVISFNGTQTTAFVGQTVTTPRTGLPDALLGLASTLLTQEAFDAVRMRSYRYSSFIQDDWRVTGKLTLNLGLRYDFFQPFHEEQDRFANFDLSTGRRLVPQDARPVVVNTLGLPNGNLPPGWQYAPLDRIIPQDQWTDIQPRVGLAYALGNRLVLRGGYGIFYDVSTSNSFNNSGTEGNPFFFDFSATTDLTHPADLRNGLPASGIAKVLASPSFGAYYAPIDRHDPYSEKWSATIDWSPLSNSGVEIGYIGQRALHFAATVPGNTPAQPGPTSLVSREPYPNVGFFYEYLPQDDSNYNALTITWNQRATHRLTFHSAFTLSKALGFGSGSEPDSFTNRWDLNYDYGPLPFDMGERWTSSWIYDLPKPAGLPAPAQAVLGNWQLSGIVTLESGMHFTVTDSGAVLNLGSLGGTGNRPNALRNPALPTGQRTIARWFDTGAFANPAPYTWGNEGKDIMTGPGYAVVDFALQKNIPLFSKEQRRLLFRMEATNLFNHPNFGFPNSNLSSPSFGRIQGIRGGPRNLQAVLRIEF